MWNGSKLCKHAYRPISTLEYVRFHDDTDRPIVFENRKCYYHTTL